MAREVSVEEYMEKQLMAGHKVTNNDAQSRALFNQLKSECPDVEEDALVRSFATPGFGTKNVEAAVYATVRLKQFNAHNPAPAFKDIFAHLLPKDIIDDVRTDAEFREQFAQLLNEIEEEYDAEGGITDVDIRKEIKESIG